MKKPVANLSASVRQRLLNLATERKEDFGLVLTRYGLERFLYRLSVSPYRDSFVLKGALLTATLDGGDVSSNARSRSARTKGFQHQLPEDLLRGVLTKGGRRWPDISSRHDSGGENP